VRQSGMGLERAPRPMTVGRPRWPKKQLLSLTSSIRLDAIPEKIDDVAESELELTMLEISMRRSVPGRAVSLGPRLRRLRRRNRGASKCRAWCCR